MALHRRLGDGQQDGEQLPAAPEQDQDARGPGRRGRAGRAGPGADEVNADYCSVIRWPRKGPSIFFIECSGRGLFR